MLDMITILGVNAAIQHANKKLYLFDKEILAVALDGTCTFDDGSEVMLEPEHLQDIKLQVQGRAPTFHAPKPVTTRDTQFAGFAKAVVNDLRIRGAFPMAPVNRSYKGPHMEQIIAQRAYDLVIHALHTTDYLDRFELEDVMQEIPDLTELPEVSE